MNTLSYKASLTLTALLTILSSCQKEADCVGDDNPSGTVEQQTLGTIRFKSVALSGGAQEVSITNAGLFIGDPVNVKNVLLNISADGAVTPSVRLDWAKEQTMNSDFVAYSPYNSSYSLRTTVPFEIQSDQSTRESFAASDLLVAKTLAKPSDEAVSLDFRHKLSQVVVYFDNKTEEQIEKVEFLKMTNCVELDLETGDVVRGYNTADLTAFKDASETCFRLIVPAGTCDFNMRITLSNGLTLSRIAKGVSLMEGRYYDNAEEPIVLENVNAQAISLNFTASDWVDGGQLNFNRGAAGGYDSVADLTSAATSEPKSFNAYLKDFRITYVYPSGNKAFAQDPSGGVVIYGKCGNLGGQYTGEISGTVSLYNGSPEFKSLDVSKAWNTGFSSMPVEYLTLEELMESFNRYISCRILLDNINVVKGISVGDAAARTGEIEQDGTTIQIYNDSNNAILPTGFKGSLIAYPNLYNGIKELFVCESDWFSGESTTAAAFRKETVPGLYRISGDTCESIITQAPGIQTSFGVRPGYCNYFIFDQSGRSSVLFRIETDNLSAGQTCPASISTIGTTAISTGTYQYVVVKQLGNTAWLYSEQSATGIIINN